MQKICTHLAEQGSANFDIYYHFTGQGTQYDIVCNECAKTPDEIPANLREVSAEVFQSIDTEFYYGVIGRPSILERITKLNFTHQEIRLALPDSEILDIRPIKSSTESEWIALLKSGELIKLNLTVQTNLSLYTLPPETLQFTENTRLVMAPNMRFLAIVNDYGSDGVVIDLAQNTITMKLNRGDYHGEQTAFPIAFYEESGKTYLAHGSDWNRLDISEPENGKLLTDRVTEWVGWREGAPRPEHYLDYFHAALLISPNGAWIAEDGWVWHPFGMTRLWNFQEWLHRNMWESDDGQSVKTFTQRGYFWNAPLCWVDNDTLAVWGFGDEDEWIFPAVLLFDANTGKRKFWFAGPEKGLLEFDRYLFSASDKGTDVWDIVTGERLLHDPELNPRCYHHGTRGFLTLLPENTFRLSRLVEEKEAPVA